MVPEMDGASSRFNIEVVAAVILGEWYDAKGEPFNFFSKVCCFTDWDEAPYADFVILRDKRVILWLRSVVLIDEL